MLRAAVGATMVAMRSRFRAYPGEGAMLYFHPATGTHVEVRNRLDGRWARGFEIIKHEDGGYRLRRLSDDVELPLVFHEDDVRREKKRGTWWY